MSVAITGASGKLGRGTAQLLIDHLDPREVALLTRSPDRLDDLAKRGAIVRRADFDEPGSLPAALPAAAGLTLADMAPSQGT